MIQFDFEGKRIVPNQLGCRRQVVLIIIFIYNFQSLSSNPMWMRKKCFRAMIETFLHLGESSPLENGMKLSSNRVTSGGDDHWEAKTRKIFSIIFSWRSITPLWVISITKFVNKSDFYQVFFLEGKNFYNLLYSHWVGCCHCLMWQMITSAISY